MKGRYVGLSSPIYCINGKIYDILSVEHGMYRVVDETGDDYLYHKEDFEIVEEGEN